MPTFLGESCSLNAELLAGALKRYQNFFEIVAYSVDSADAVRKVDEFSPEIALISVQLQDGPTAGYKVIQHIKANHPQTAIVALLNDSNREHLIAAFRYGARGTVSREQPFRLLAKCLRKVHEGEIWATNDQIEFIFDLLHTSSGASNKPPTPQPPSSTVLEKLTPREKEVVSHVIQGMRNSEIGEALRVSEHTVRNYIMKIYEKLGVSNRVQLTRQCAPLFTKE